MRGLQALPSSRSPTSSGCRDRRCTGTSARQRQFPRREALKANGGLLVPGARAGTTGPSAVVADHPAEAGAGCGELGEFTGANLVELPAEVEARIALRLVALGTELADLLTGQFQIDAGAGGAGRAVSRGRARTGLFPNGGLDVSSHAPGIGEPGRAAGRASGGGGCDLVAVVLQRPDRFKDAGSLRSAAPRRASFRTCAGVRLCVLAFWVTRTSGRPPSAARWCVRNWLVPFAARRRPLRSPGALREPWRPVACASRSAPAGTRRSGRSANRSTNAKKGPPPG
jgi:hypothetical protein